MCPLNEPSRLVVGVPKRQSSGFEGWPPWRTPKTAVHSFGDVADPKGVLHDPHGRPGFQPFREGEISPSTSALDRGDKMKIYAREHVPWLWFVDPIGRTLEILSLDGATYRVLDVFTDEAPVRARPLDAIELELGAMFVPGARDS